MITANSTHHSPSPLSAHTTGMDYCFIPGAPILSSSSSSSSSMLPPPTPNPTMPKGCSAEVRFCPGGSIVRQNPSNNCEFDPCPTSTNTADMTENSAAVAYRPATPPPSASPVTSSPTFDASTFFCGYNLSQVNGNCRNARPCPSGRDSQCPGLEVCIRDSNCGDLAMSSTVTAATAAAALTEEEMCDELCIEPLPSSFCPVNLDLPNCLEVGLGEVCEADGECATDEKLNNCGTYDIYARVVCGPNTPSQGQIMRGTLSPTPGPTDSPTPPPSLSPTTASPTRGPTPSPTPLPTVETAAPTVNAGQLAMESMSNAAASTGADVTSVSTTAAPEISIADAIAEATANAAASASQQAASQGPTFPPIKEYQSNAAAAFKFDRTPSEQELPVQVEAANDPAPEVGSSEWYSTVYGDASGTEAAQDGSGFNFDSYFRNPHERNAASTARSLVNVVPIILVGIFAAMMP